MDYQDYRRSKKHISKTTLIVSGLLFFASVVVFSAWQLNFNTVYFLTPKEAQDDAKLLSGKVIRVGGMVQAGSLDFDKKATKSKFILSNLKNTKIDVIYYGLLPDMFKEGQGVVVEGKISETGNLIEARKLMVKHSEEYKFEDNYDSMNNMNKKLLEKSLFKD